MFLFFPGAPPPQHSERLSSLRVAELKDILRQLRERLSGAKTELLARVCHQLSSPHTHAAALQSIDSVW